MKAGTKISGAGRLVAERRMWPDDVVVPAPRDGFALSTVLKLQILEPFHLVALEPWLMTNRRPAISTR